VKVIVAGSRDIADFAAVSLAIESSGFAITEIVSGAAKGVDTLGERWASENGVAIKRFPANWAEHGKAAGPIRNREMARYGDALVAIWDGVSNGTQNMIDEAVRAGLVKAVDNRLHAFPTYGVGSHKNNLARLVFRVLFNPTKNVVPGSFFTVSLKASKVMVEIQNRPAAFFESGDSVRIVAGDTFGVYFSYVINE
jgi:hypothetical protein